MIKSCKECKTKCCKVGPGPYKTKPFDEFYSEAATHVGYNTVCENFDLDTELCRVWKTALPLECQVYVCHVKEYTDIDLKLIKMLSKSLDFS